MNDTKHAPPPVPGDEQTGEPIESNISLLEYESSADGTTAVKATTTDGKQAAFTVALPDNISANVGREILKPLAEKLTQANDSKQEAEPPKVIELNITGADEDNYILTSDRNKVKTSDGEPLTFVIKIPKRFMPDADLLQATIDAAAGSTSKESPKVLDIRNLPNVVITDKNLQFALTTYRNQHAYVVPIDYEKLNFAYDEKGEVVINTEAQHKALAQAADTEKPKARDAMPGNAKIKTADIDHPLLRQLFSATMKAYLCRIGDTITVSLPSFAREMGIDTRYSNLRAQAEDTKQAGEIPKHNSNDFFKKLKMIESLHGVWEGGSFYRVFTLQGYDKENNTLTFSSPWLFKIINELLQTPTNRRTKKDGSVMWEITGLSYLMKSNIVSARSEPTVEIIATLIAGLQQYGVTPEAKRHSGKKYKDNDLVEYTITFKTLIERIPLIMEKLAPYNGDNSNTTTLLQRYFCGSNFKKRLENGKGYILQEYINKYTYLPEYYKDFEIDFKPPTANTLSDKITIRHHGINGSFNIDNPLKQLRFQDIAPGE